MYFGVGVQFLFVGELYPALVAVKGHPRSMVMEMVLKRLKGWKLSSAEMAFCTLLIITFVIIAFGEVVVLSQRWFTFITFLRFLAKVALMVFSEGW